MCGWIKEAATCLENNTGSYKNLHYHNKIFITTAEINGLYSADYGNGILYSEWKIFTKI